MKLRNIKYIAALLIFGFCVNKSPENSSSNTHSIRSLGEFVLLQQASESFLKSDSNKVVIVTNAITSVRDSIIKIRINLEGKKTGIPIEVFSSNPEVVDFYNNTNVGLVTGGELQLQPQGKFGRSVITARIKGSKTLYRSSQVYVQDMSLTFYDSVFNAQIISDEDIATLDPLDPTSKGFMRMKHSFRVIEEYVATEFAGYTWEVKSDEKIPAVLTVSSDKKSCEVLFPQGGEYAIVLKQASNGSKLDSLPFSVLANPSIKTNASLGLLESYTDPRDSTKYDISFFEKNGKYLGIFKQSLSYMPLVLPEGIPTTNTNLPIIVKHGNTGYYNPVVVKKQNGIVLYNQKAMTGKLSFTAEDIDQLYTPTGQKGICPRGWRIPSVDSLEKYFDLSNLSTSSTVSYSNASLNTKLDIKEPTTALYHVSNGVYHNKDDAGNIFPDFYAFDDGLQGSRPKAIYTLGLSGTKGIIYVQSDKKAHRVRCVRYFD